METVTIEPVGDPSSSRPSTSRTSSTASSSPTSRSRRPSRKASVSPLEAFFQMDQHIDEFAPSFVSDFTYRSVHTVTDSVTGDSKLVYRPARGDVALMFIDLSGYSKLAARLEAYDLAAVINAYFSKILDVVNAAGGDVLKFAGDAIMVVWAATNDTQHQHPGRSFGGSLESCCQEACQCALDLQQQCGAHSFEDIDLGIHIGISAGVLEGEVLFPTPSVARAGLNHERKSNSGMAEAYHFIGGDALQKIGTYVDGAPSGEVCVSKRVLDFAITDTLTSKEVEGTGGDAWLISTAKSGTKPCEDVKFPLDDTGETAACTPDLNRMVEVDSKFLFPNVAAWINQGVPLDQMETNRTLYVLFIKKVTKSVPVYPWFAEVSEILDKYRCPITQVIDDDKGIHIVAALNLFVNEPNAADVAVNLVAELINRETGCSIGLASGSAMCGIQGNRRSCRYDITGNCVVRACRLMQYADQFWDSRCRPKKLSCEKAQDDEYYGPPQVAVDMSIVQALNSKSMVRLHGMTKIKGAADPIPIFTLSYLAFRGADALSCITGATELTTDVHADARRRVKELATDPEKVTNVCVISGPLNVGKASIVISVLQDLPTESKYASFLHVCTRGGQPYDLLRTMASWFSYHPSHELKTHASKLKKALANHQQVLTVSVGMEIVSACINLGIRIAMTVKKAQFIDADSLKFITGAARIVKFESSNTHLGEGSIRPATGQQQEQGKWLWFLCLTPMQGAVGYTVIEKQVLPTKDVLEHLSVKRMTGAESLLVLRDFHGGAVRPASIESWCKLLDASMKVSDGCPQHLRAMLLTQMAKTNKPTQSSFISIKRMQVPDDNNLPMVSMSSGRFYFSDVAMTGLASLPIDAPNDAYEPSVLEQLDSLGVMQQAIVTTLGLVAYGCSTRTTEQWFPASMICTVVNSFFPMSAHTVDELMHKDVLLLEFYQMINLRRFPVDRLKKIRTAERNGESFEGGAWRSGDVISAFDESTLTDADGETVTLINLPSTMITAAMIKTLTPMQCMWSAHSLTLYYYNSVEWQDIMTLSDWVAAANTWAKLGKDSKRAAAFLHQASDAYDKILEKEGKKKNPEVETKDLESLACFPHAQCTNQDLADDTYFHRVAYHLDQIALSQDLLSHIPKGHHPQPYPLSLCKVDKEKGVVPMPDRYNFLTDLEVPLVLGPLAGMLNQMTRRMVNHTYNINDTGFKEERVANDAARLTPTERKALSQSRITEKRSLPDMKEDDVLDLIQRFDLRVPGEPSVSWEEEKKEIHHMFELYENTEESLDRMTRAGKYIEAAIDNRTQRMNEFVNTKECDYSQEPVDPEKDPRAALTMKEGLLRAFGRIKHITVPDLENGEEKKKELSKPKVQLAMRDCLMDLSASNWSTSYYYQNPAALRDLWLTQGLDALDFKGLIFGYLLLMADCDTSGEPRIST